MITCKRALQFPERQCPHVRERCIPGRLDHNLNASRDIDRRNALHVADVRDLKDDVAVFAAHAPTCTGHLAQTAFSDAMS